MSTNRCTRLLPLLFLLLGACAVGPTAADVAADRDRWTAVRDVAADDMISATEKPVFHALLAAWDQKLAADEAAVAAGTTTVQDLLRVYGLAAVQVWVGPELEKRAPELFRFVDQNSDRVLSEQELLAVDPKSPVFALVVASTAARLLAKKG